MAHIERKLSSKPVFEGKIVNVYHDTVELENGNQAFREVIRHPGAVAVLALDGEEILLVRQYRYCIGQELLEIPAGKREAGEDPFLTAQRELEEEVGATAAQWQELGCLIPSPGCYGETLWMYLARQLSFGAAHPDEDEFLECSAMDFDALYEMCMDGRVQDAKTVAAILKVKLLLGL